jgi:predicted alpha/beta hydrolase family esterase
MENYFIIHGSGGTPYSNWFEWLFNELTKKQKLVYVPMMPTLYKQNFENWSKILKAYQEIGLIDKNTTFICHSSAPSFLVKYILSNKIKIKKAIFVCGANNFISGFSELDTVNSTFFMKDISKFQEYCDQRICIYSDNDKYINLDALKDFANEINAQHVVISGAGHINAEVGYTKFKEILKYI